MAQTPNTTSLGLNQWGPEDDIRTAQFTEDNRIVDEELEKRAVLPYGSTNWNSENLIIDSYVATLLNGWAAYLGNPDYMPTISRIGNTITITACLTAGIGAELTSVFMLPSWAIPLQGRLLATSSPNNPSGGFGVRQIGHAQQGSVVVSAGGTTTGRMIILSASYGIS